MFSLIFFIKWCLHEDLKKYRDEIDAETSYEMTALVDDDTLTHKLSLKSSQGGFKKAGCVSDVLALVVPMEPI